MRIISKSRTHFHGTHRGCEIVVEREPVSLIYPGLRHRFYITVTHADGGHLYDGWAPEDITTMKQARQEALRGAGLDARVVPTRACP